MGLYFNEFEPFAADWLEGLFPAAVVDRRSILEVGAHEEALAAAERAHFFAGIGGWELALRLAGWPEDRPVWTGSCPCQPFSSAGRREGFEDERDLWPAFFKLIRERRPGTVFGEQVEKAIGFGWVDRARRDLEGEGYAVWFSVLGAHSVAAPHRRLRVYWAAVLPGALRDYERAGRSVADGQSERRERAAGAGDEAGRPGPEHCESGSGVVHGIGPIPIGSAPSAGDPRGLADDDLRGREGEQEHDERQGSRVFPVLEGLYPVRRSQDPFDCGEVPGFLGPVGPVCEVVPRSPFGGPWDRFRFVRCSDGKLRRVPAEPEVFPLAHGVPGRVGLLRAYGNAIVPQVAALFVRAFLEGEREAFGD